MSLESTLKEPDRKLLAQLRRGMESYFGHDIRRINHAHEVTNYAAKLLSFIDADPLLTLTAAYLHDIGIPEAERKYGSCHGKLQEQEGPPVARQLLAAVGVAGELSDKVCCLVGCHHTPHGVDSPEFRILWDADALVNLEELLPGKDPETVVGILDKAFVTEAGLRLAKEKFLPAE